MKENECNVFDGIAKVFESKSTNCIQGEKNMKYTKEEIKAMYEYDKMICGDFVDFEEYRKILKKAQRKNKRKIFFILKNLANIIV